MKSRILIVIGAFFLSHIGQAMACSVCYGAPGAKSTEHMAVAIWFMLGAIMSVLGGIGAFTFRLWRHANTPLEPHQELANEDFAEYD